MGGKGSIQEGYQSRSYMGQRLRLVPNYLKTNRLEASHKFCRGEYEARRSPISLAAVGVCLKRD
jgi:hypothetical protein